MMLIIGFVCGILFSAGVMVATIILWDMRCQEKEEEKRESEEKQVAEE